MIFGAIFDSTGMNRNVILGPTNLKIGFKSVQMYHITLITCSLYVSLCDKFFREFCLHCNVYLLLTSSLSLSLFLPLWGEVDSIIISIHHICDPFIW